MIDWIALSRAFPDFLLTLFVVIIIVYFNRENKAASKIVMAEWRVYLAEQTKEFADKILEQDKLFIDHLTERQNVVDLRLQQQEQLFSRSLTDVVTKHELEVSKITAQNQQLITTTVNNLSEQVKRNSVDVRKMTSILMKKPE